MIGPWSSLHHDASWINIVIVAHAKHGHGMNPLALQMHGSCWHWHCFHSPSAGRWESLSQHSRIYTAKCSQSRPCQDQAATSSHWLKPLLVTLDGPMAQFGPNTLCCSSTIGFSSSPAAPASSPTPMPLWLLEWHLAISQFAKRRAAGASQNTCQMFEWWFVSVARLVPVKSKFQNPTHVMRLWCVCALSFSVSFHWSWLKAPWTPEAAELGVWLKNWVKGAFKDGSCDAWRNNNYKTKQLEIRLIRSADRHWSIWTQNIGQPDRHSSLALTWYGTGTGYWYLVNSVQQSGSQRLSASQCTVSHSHSLSLHNLFDSIPIPIKSNFKFPAGIKR